MLRFAVAGTPASTPGSGGTIKGLYRAAELGIRAMEMEWVQRVPSNAAHIAEIGDVAKKLDITLTVHAPYYVNLNSPDPAKLDASIKRVVMALQMAEIAGARSVCVHPAFYLGMPPEKAYDNVCKAVERILKDKTKLFPHVNLGLETMGRPGQFGTLDEVLRVSKAFDLYPVIDPAHMHARDQGAWNTAEEWHAMFDAYAKHLGNKALQNMHMHFTGIAYGKTGEKHHLPLQESDARWKDFLGVLKEREIGGTVVCESPLLEKDTLLLQETFAKM